jgi:hypothetical protein
MISEWNAFAKTNAICKASLEARSKSVATKILSSNFMPVFS